MRKIYRHARKLIPIMLLLFFVQYGYASDLVEVRPITDKILMIFIKDGHIDSYGVGEGISDNITYINATNLTKALRKSNYLFSSTNDANYATPLSPIFIGRKSKAVDYNDEYQAIPYVLGHWIYIELPTAMVQGKSYTLQINNIVENKFSESFIYDVNKLRSPTVHVNMVGFPQNAPKYAYLSQWMGDFNSPVHTQGGLELDDKAGAPFRLIRVSNGAVAFSGTITKRLDKSIQESDNNDYGPEKNYSHSDVWQCDFSSFTSPGEYIVAVDGIGCSYAFEIGNDITREPFYYAMKGLFWQRQGIVKEIEPGKIMPRDHHPDDIIWRWDPAWPGSEDASGFNTSAQRVQGIWGHYHDAGDWDNYVRHAITPINLLLLYELAPTKFNDGDINNRYKLSDGSAWINEGANGLPDLLDEAVWLINYYKRARSVLQNNYGGTGGVPGYAGRDAIPGNNTTAWQDTRDWYLSAENTEATFYYAGLAAWYAEVLNIFHRRTSTGNHPEYQSWINEATSAWNWANARSNPPSDQKGFAAVCLYRSTGNTDYQTIFQNYFNEAGDYKYYSEWSDLNLINASASIYAFLPSTTPGLTTAFQSSVKTYITTLADDLRLNPLNANAFRAPMERAQFFQLGAFSTARTTMVGVAHKLTNDNKYLAAMQNAASYVLGGNQLNMAYLSGLGEQSDVYIFNPNGWLVNNYNSKVYSNEPNIGYTSYFGSNGGPSSSYWFLNSAYSEYFSRTGAYPQAQNFGNVWPESESKFYNRYSIQGGEFTINQTTSSMIYTMGYVNAMANSNTAPYVPNNKPTVQLALQDNETLTGDSTNLTATASADTRSVKYYYDWHYIGESTDRVNNFKYTWRSGFTTAANNLLITAVAYDDKGVKSDPNALAVRTVNVTASTPRPLTAVSVSPETATMTASSISQRVLQLEIDFSPSNASNRTVVWTSSDTTVAKVDSEGLVTSISDGVATITATAQDGGVSSSSIITVNSQNIPDYVIADYDVVVPTIQSYITGTTQNFSSGVITMVSNPFKNVATNNSDNVVKFDRQATTYSVIGYNLQTNKSIQAYDRFSFEVYGSNLQQIYYRVVSSEGATVVENFQDININNTWGRIDILIPDVNIPVKEIVIFPNPNNPTVATYYLDNVKFSRLAPGEIVSLDVSPAIDSVAMDQTLQLNAAAIPNIPVTITWSSSNPSVATVSATGLVSPLLPGNVVITASANNGAFTNSSSIKIKPVANPCQASGNILFERFNSISGSTLSTLFNASVYPNNPSSATLITKFEIASNAADNYGARVRGYICAPQTGTYYFWIAGDDQSLLNLSNNESPLNVRSIARSNSWTSSREWNKYATQKSEGIFLVKGKRYYVEAFVKENTGGDNLAVGWRKPNDGNGTAPIEVIPGTVLSPLYSGPIITTRIEAENAAVVSGPYTFDYSGASNGKLIGGFDNIGAYVEWRNIPASPSLTIAYSIANAATRGLYINGLKVKNLQFSQAQGIATITVSVNIPANATVRIQKDASDVNYTDLDYIELVDNLSDAVAPSIPTGITYALTSAGATFSWQAATDNVGVSGYDVYNGTTLVASTATTSAILPSIICSKTFSITVRAKDAAGNVSNKSAALTGTFTCSTQTNIALRKPSFASSFETQYPVAAGNDGSTTTRWAAASAGTNESWHVDLGGTYNVDGGQVIWELNNTIYRYKIDVSQDGTSWTSVLDNSNNTASGQSERFFLNATARYVRVIVTSVANNISRASFFEARIFGTVNNSAGREAKVRANAESEQSSESPSSEMLAVYPNPSNGLVNIRSYAAEPSQVLITNLTGISFGEVYLKPFAEEQITLPKGIYIISNPKQRYKKLLFIN